MTAQIGEPFLLMISKPDGEKNVYCLATVEEVRNGKIVAARIPGPTVYRTAPEDHAIRFTSQTVRDALQNLIDKPALRSPLWTTDQNQIMKLILDEVAAHVERQSTANSESIHVRD